jgi:hypothetical protein
VVVFPLFSLSLFFFFSLFSSSPLLSSLSSLFFPVCFLFHVCLLLVVSTVKVESLFSVMNYNKSGCRSRLNDSTVCAIAQVQMLEPQLLATGVGATSMKIDTSKALDHTLPPTAQRW